MNKNQWRSGLGFLLAMILAALASFALIRILESPTAFAISYIPEQPYANLILFLTTHVIIGTLTIVLARHIFLFYPTVSLNGSLVFQGMKTRKYGFEFEKDLARWNLP